MKWTVRKHSSIFVLIDDAGVIVARAGSPGPLGAIARERGAVGVRHEYEPKCPVVAAQ